MTATERLRQLLDERGVEHTDFGGITAYVNADGRICRTYRRPEPLTVNVAIVAATPEQAVEATLGRGTCKDLAEFRGFGTKTEFKCSECGYEYSAVGGFGCDYGDEPDFDYCPNCGRRVES